MLVPSSVAAAAAVHCLTRSCSQFSAIFPPIQTHTLSHIHTNSRSLTYGHPISDPCSSSSDSLPRRAAPAAAVSSVQQENASSSIPLVTGKANLSPLLSCISATASRRRLPHTARHLRPKPPPPLLPRATPRRQLLLSRSPDRSRRAHQQLLRDDPTTQTLRCCSSDRDQHHL